VSVLVLLGFSNDMLWTGWFVNSRKLLLMVLESEKSKIRELADLVSGENSLSAL
jgi:hypothetical protein